MLLIEDCLSPITATRGEVLDLGIRQANTSCVAGEGTGAAVGTNLVVLESEQLTIIRLLIGPQGNILWLGPQERGSSRVPLNTYRSIRRHHIQRHRTLLLHEGLLLHCLGLCGRLLHSGRRIQLKEQSSEEGGDENRENQNCLVHCPSKQGKNPSKRISQVRPKRTHPRMNYNSMSLVELKQQAKGRRIKQYYIMKRHQLIQLLSLPELPQSIVFEKLTILQLREEAKTRGIRGFWGLSRGDLLELLHPSSTPLSQQKEEDRHDPHKQQSPCDSDPN